MPTQSNTPTKLNLDKDLQYLTEFEAAYLLNHERAVGGVKSSLDKSTPLAANYPFGQVTNPAGETYSVGGLSDEITNEVYSLIYNSNGAHYLQRLSDKNGLQVVYDKGCLELSADPQYAIEPFRSILRLDEVYNKNNDGCKNRHGIQYIWTDGKNPIGCIDVEASIATNGFTTPFFDICPDPCSMIRLCVPEICGAITAEFVPRSPADVGMANRLLQKGFKFRVRHIYYDGRASEWSDISTLYFLNEQGCFQSLEVQPRCLKLFIPIGNPMVERIEVAFSNGTLADDGANEVWKLYDTIEKYKKYNNNQEKWYERDLAEDVSDTFNPDTCEFEYLFCNDKDCITIDPKETSRVFNPLPRQPQAIIRIKENNFGFVNYIQGNCPVDKTEIDKFNVAVNCTPEGCPIEYATVKVRAVIRLLRGASTSFVYRMNGVMGGEDDINDAAFFGGNISGDDPDNADKPIKNAAGQEFNNARNFTAYIEGTDYFVEMKQWKATNGFTNREEVGIISGMGIEASNFRRRPYLVTGSGYFYQEAIFKVPKGTRGIIRLRSHMSPINDADTSTTAYATFPLSLFSSNNESSNINDIRELWKTEIEFDTCNGDNDLDEAFAILAVNGYTGDGDDDSEEYLYQGYISDVDGDPVANALLFKGSEVISQTDHNGFYFSYDQDQDSDLGFNVRVEKDCSSFSNVETVVMTGINLGYVSRDITISDVDYGNRFYNNVKVSVLDCNNNPIRGIMMAITEGKATLTDAVSGVATFKVRNKVTRDMKVRVYAMDKEGCFTVSCEGVCNPCMPQTNLIPLIACFASQGLTTTATTNERINTAGVGAVKKGLKKGGLYPMGIVLQGDCGILSSVYELPPLYIPKIQQTGTNDNCVLSYSATGFTAPTHFNCLKLVRGLNINDYQLQWVVDKIQKVADNKIILTIQSLNDYNEQYFFKTNTIYQWLEGDRIEFIRDENGDVILASQYGILNYLTISPFHDTLVSGRTEVDANYFNQLIIEDDGKIDFLKAGSVIEIQRVKECTTDPVYFQIASIPIVNGRLLIESGTFETFDTYETKRIINGSALQIFEHHSPSDFWGAKLSDVGKVYFANIYENERRFGRNISINAAFQFNYFGDLVKTMPATQQGDIIAVRVIDGRVMLAICENDNFLAQIADDLLRVGGDGMVRALPTDAIVGNPEAKISGMFGCRYSDIGSIYFGDGFVTWYDGNKYRYVKHDYRFARDVDVNKVQTYFRTIGVKMDAVNKSADNDLDKIRWATGYNELTSAVMLTNKALRHQGYNNDQELYASPNTTILFHPETEDFLTFAGFTAERYSNMTLNDGFGCAFIAYYNGKPYIHPVIPEKYNEFFGVATDRVVTLSINKYAQKERMPLAFELQSDMMYFVSKVETSDPNFRSEIPPAKVKRFGNKWNSAFMRNINSVGGLFNGKEANDYWIKVTFVRDNTQELNGKPIYGSIDNVKRIKFDLLGMILFRFQLSEQSGFPENTQ